MFCLVTGLGIGKLDFGHVELEELEILLEKMSS